MKTINIFLASSLVEFERERQDLAAHVNSLNNIGIENDIFLKLEKCEDMSDAVEMGRKQERYNKRIKNSHYFLMLIGRDVGQYTIEEFDVALEHFQEHGTPTILPYFKKFPDGEQVSESVLKFMERLDKQLGHFYKQYTDLSELEMKFTMEILRNVGIGSTLEIQDGWLIWNEQQVMSLEDVPLYKGNKGLQQKKEQKKALDEEYAALMPKLAERPAEDGLLERKGKLEQERGAIQEVIYQMERDMFRECQETAQKRQLGMHMNWREKKAMEFVDKGDYESAKNILRDIQWEEEIRQAQEKIKRFTGERREQQLVEIRRYIFGKKVLISYIKMTGLTPESVDEIKIIYENITEKAMEYQTEQRVLQEYAEFLVRQDCLQQGIAVAEKLRQYYKSDEETLNKYKAELLLRLSDWYRDVGETKKSEQCIWEALKIISFIPNDLERESLKALADGYMGICLRKMGQVEKAEKWSREALEMSISLSEENPKDNTLHWILGRNMSYYTEQMFRIGKKMKTRDERDEKYKEAEEYDKKAIAIYEDLTKNYSDDSWCSLFPEREKMACELQQNYRYLAFMIQEWRGRAEWATAERYYRKSLEIGRPIAARNPKANERVMALSCKELAGLLEKSDRDEEAKDLYQESWEVCKSLSARYPGKYRNFAGQTCVEFAVFLERKKRKSYRSPFDDFYEGEESLDIYRKEGPFFKYICSFNSYSSHYLYSNAKTLLGNAAWMSRDAYRFVPNLSYAEEWYSKELDHEWKKYVNCALDTEVRCMQEERGRYLTQEELDSITEKRLVAEGKMRHWVNWMQECTDEMFRKRRKISMSREEWLETKRPEGKKIEDMFRQALYIFQRLDERKDIKVPQWDFLLYYEERGTMLWKLMNQVEEADEMYEKACEIAQSYEDKDTYKMSVSRIYLKRAMTLAAMNRMWESEEFMQKSRKCEVLYNGVWEYKKKPGGKSR